MGIWANDLSVTVHFSVITKSGDENRYFLSPPLFVWDGDRIVWINKEEMQVFREGEMHNNIINQCS